MEMIDAQLDSVDTCLHTAADKIMKTNYRLILPHQVKYPRLKVEVNVRLNPTEAGTYSGADQKLDKAIVYTIPNDPISVLGIVSA
jgi:hypothetical protein